MMNNVILIGRLVNDLELKNLENSKVLNVNVAVPRPYKSDEGVQKVDFIRCVMWNNIAERCNEFCKKGDLVSIRGSLQVSQYELEDGTKRNSYEVLVDKIGFLSSKKEITEGE